MVISKYVFRYFSVCLDHTDCIANKINMTRDNLMELEVRTYVVCFYMSTTDYIFVLFLKKNSVSKPDIHGSMNYD